MKIEPARAERSVGLSCFAELIRGAETKSRGKRTSAAHDPTGNYPLFDEPASGRRIEVAVAMQPALFRDALSRALDTVPGLRVVASGPGEDQIDRIPRLKPRVLLLDDEVLSRKGERIVRCLHRAAPATRTLVMTTRSDEAALDRALRAGAYGLVEKGADLETLACAIQAVAAGDAWASRQTAARTLQHRPSLPGPSSRLDVRLTKRESEVAGCVGQGLRNRDIAFRLNISQRTVKVHLTSIFRKLKLEGRVALGLLARSGIGPKT